MQSHLGLPYDQPSMRYLRAVAAALGPKLAATDKLFCRRLTGLGLTGEEQSALHCLTPGAAVRAVEQGVSPAGYFRQVADAARILALRNIAFDQVLQALREYDRAAEPVYRSVPEVEAKNARRASKQLHSAVILFLQQAFASVQEAESVTLHEVLRAELQATTVPELLQALLTAAGRHFAADRGSVFVPDSAGDAAEYRCIASLSVAPQGAFAPSRERLRALQTLGDGDASLAIEPGWPESVWSVPVGSAILQLGFEPGRTMLPREAEFVTLLAERCSAALARLSQAAQAQQMSVRMLEVEELERRRISRELHDDAAQALAVLRLQLEMAEFSVPADAVELTARLGEMRELTEQTIRSVRGLISDLSPAVLEQLGLAAAVRQLANRFQSDRDVHVRLQVSKLARMHPRLEVVVYRVVQECFRNIAQHSQAANINVFLASSDGHLRLDIQDDGVGFCAEEALGRRNCYGLVGIRERVTLLGGSFSVESPHSGSNRGDGSGGTKVSVVLPLTAELP